MAMNQPKTDYGQRGETGEKIPTGVKSSDGSGTKSVRVTGGVGMGKADGLGLRSGSHLGKIEGHTGELNDGNKGERKVYEHKRIPHDQDKG